MGERVRIWRRPKTAMQSGMAKTHEWILAFQPGSRRPDPLMGWIGGAGTDAQVEL
ncbi:MAG: NADH dehydrogenase ubiquinone Fe-S protein 4, partial [Acidobacteriota bacterium]